MELDGGGWTRIHHHVLGAGDFFPTCKTVDFNTEDPAANLYSIMSMVDNFKEAESKYEVGESWYMHAFSFWAGSDLSCVCLADCLLRRQSLIDDFVSLIAFNDMATGWLGSATVGTEFVSF